MAVSSIIKKKVKKWFYYYLVTSGRVNGKPRIVSQKYLGTAEDIAKAVDAAKTGSIPEPEFSTVFDFGAVCALFDLAERLGVRDAVNAHAGKRSQGLPVGDSMLLAAINRAVLPKSKNEFFSWFEKTVLHNKFPAANKKSLSSQGFWNNMSHLGGDKIRRIEDDLAKTVVERYGLSTECLLFDNTNFFTYLDASNPSELARFGKSKQKRSDLKIIGLSLMASPENNIPLFHEAYPGNKNDARRFSEVIGSLKERYLKIHGGGGEITLVFDKGNNNESNFDELLNEEPCRFHFVGGLRLSQCPDLLDVPAGEYVPLEGERLEGESAYRTARHMYNKETAVLVTYNPELYETQLEGILGNIRKCCGKLHELQANLRAWGDGEKKKGKKPAAGSVSKKIDGILSAQHMKEVFDISIAVSARGGLPEITYSESKEKLEALKARVLGKSILFTDRMDWPNEKIVTSYRAQYHIEDCFKQMKDTKYHSFTPIHHWTDKMIRVHAFYCVLALMLSNVLNREIEGMGYKMSVKEMLGMLSEVQQVITVFPQRGKKHISKSSFSRLNGVAKDIIDKFDLMKHQIKL
jgi:transposase